MASALAAVLAVCGTTQGTALSPATTEAAARAAARADPGGGLRTAASDLAEAFLDNPPGQHTGQPPNGGARPSRCRSCGSEVDLPGWRVLSHVEGRPLQEGRRYSGGGRVLSSPGREGMPGGGGANTGKSSEEQLAGDGVGEVAEGWNKDRGQP